MKIVKSFLLVVFSIASSNSLAQRSELGTGRRNSEYTQAEPVETVKKQLYRYENNRGQFICQVEIVQTESEISIAFQPGCKSSGKLPKPFSYRKDSRGRFTYYQGSSEFEIRPIEDGFALFENGRGGAKLIPIPMG